MSLQLSITEFSQFNIHSKLQLLSNHGKLIAQETEKDESYWELYLLYSFYVMTEWKKNKLKKAEPILNKRWIQFYINNKASGQ